MKILITSLIGLSASVSFAGNFESTYTDVSLDKCVTISSSEMDKEFAIDYIISECPGLGGYQVGVVGGDLRYNLSLSYRGNEVQMPRLMQFHDVGSDKIEWRYERINEANGQRGIEYRALIYRLNESTVDKSGKQTDSSKLFVVRLNQSQSCTLGVIEQGKDMNKKARALADNLNAACLK